MSILEKIEDLLSEDAKKIIKKIDLSQSAEEIVKTLEIENLVSFKVSEDNNKQHDQEILEN